MIKGKRNENSMDKQRLLELAGVQLNEANWNTALDTALHNAASALVHIAVDEEGETGDIKANFEDNVKNIANVIRDKAKPMLAEKTK
jgi:hypothetical protein